MVIPLMPAHSEVYVAKRDKEKSCVDFTFFFFLQSSEQRVNVINLCIVSHSMYFRLFPCYTERNVNQCILIGLWLGLGLGFRVRV